VTLYKQYGYCRDRETADKFRIEGAEQSLCWKHVEDCGDLQRNLMRAAHHFADIRGNHDGGQFDCWMIERGNTKDVFMVPMVYRGWEVNWD